MAPNLKSIGQMSRHLSLLNISDLKHSHSFTQLSGAVSEVDFEHYHFDEPELLDFNNADVKQKASLDNHEQVVSADESNYWGWDGDEATSEQWPVAGSCQEVEDGKAAAVAAETESYWDWPAVEIKEQEPIDVLSLSNIESNLKEASRQLSAQGPHQLVQGHDDYWAETADQSVEPSKQATTIHQPLHIVSQSASYWDWNSSPDARSSKALLEKVLEDEEARKAVSMSLMDNKLVTAHAATNVVQGVAAKAANDGYWMWQASIKFASTAEHSYWDWSSQPTETKQSLVKSLLEYEAARTLLSADHVIETLKGQSNIAQTSCTKSKNSVDNYWTWSEGLGDRYWDATPQAVAVGGSSYWEW
jgi:hypothetical protein